MRESQSSPNLVNHHRNSSIRLKKRQNEMNRQYLKTRRSGEFSLSDAVDASENKLDTLDTGLVANGLQHKLRPLLLSRFRQDMLSDTEAGMGRVWGREKAAGVKITDFGMIAQAAPATR